ncbi:hypothetical protein AgCh_034438 [Apium graveolens]
MLKLGTPFPFQRPAREEILAFGEWGHVDVEEVVKQGNILGLPPNILVGYEGLEVIIPDGGTEDSWLDMSLVGVQVADLIGKDTDLMEGFKDFMELCEGTDGFLARVMSKSRGVVEELLWYISGSTNAKLHTYGNTLTDMYADYTGQGFDQLLDVISKIKNNPDDRRIILSAWNPSDLKLMALPPCHMFAQVVELPMLHPEKFVKLRIDPPRGVLCYGLPGTGKTLLARALANRTDVCFIRLIGSELVQKYVGEGARIIRELFQMAQSKKACIVFFDEIDAIGGARFDDGVAEIMRSDTLDPALLRPGRLDRKVEFGLPDLESRTQMFKIHTRTMNSERDIQFKFLARLCPNSTGADIRSVCTAAGTYAIRARRKTVKEKDFLDAVNKVIKGYQKFCATTKLKSSGARQFNGLDINHYRVVGEDYRLSETLLPESSTLNHWIGNISTFSLFFSSKIPDDAEKSGFNDWINMTESEKASWIENVNNMKAGGKTLFQLRFVIVILDTGAFFLSMTRATVYGAIVIMLKLGTPFPFQRPAIEEILAFGEWGHVDVEEVVKQGNILGLPSNMSDAHTINGKPGPLFPCYVVELPMLHPEKFVKLGIDPPRGVLCYGPLGTGKTLLARAIANRTDACFIRLIGSELVQKYVGEGARIIRKLFQMARSKKACIVFFDEIDAIGGARFDDGVGRDNEVKRTVLEIINQLDGFDARRNIKVLMMTNRPDTLDPALLRPGRLDRKVEFGLPDLESRTQMFKIHTRADIRSVCTATSMYAIRARRKTVKEKDFLDAVNKVIKGYQNFSATTKYMVYN